MRHWIWFSVAPRFRHNLCHAVHSSCTILDKRNGRGSKMPQFPSWYSLIVLTSHVTSQIRSESIWTNSSFKVAFDIARTMNFVCSIFPDCRLWIENSASFHNISSAWIPEDINAAIAACFVYAINPFIVTHTHWQWVSALVAVIWFHRFCLLLLKYASTHGMKWFFTHSRLSARSGWSKFSFQNAPSPMRMVRIYFHTSIFISQRDRDRTLTLLVTLVKESELEFSKKRTRYITLPRCWQELGSRQELLRARSRPSCCAEHDGCERDGQGHSHLDACYWGATSSVFIVTAYTEVWVSRYS